MINQCTFIGRLGADPTVNKLESGTKVAQFNIACDEPEYTRADGSKVDRRTEWIPVVLWRGLAEVAEKYVKKGDLVFIQGKFRTRTYTDKEGVTRRATEVYADTMKMLTSKGTSGAPVPQESSAPAEPQPPVDFNNDGQENLPF